MSTEIFTQYYAYILKNPLKNDLPFYVGKGKNSRYKDHWKQIKHRGYNTHLHNTITKIKNAGFDFYTYEIISCLNEQEALDKEIELIELYGKRNDGGILTNISVGGQGGDTGCGRKVKKYNVFGEYIETYDSMADAANANSQASLSSIIRCCRRTGTVRSSGGHIWCYEEEQPDWEWVFQSVKPVFQWSEDGKRINQFESRKQFEVESGLKYKPIEYFYDSQKTDRGSYFLPYGCVFTRTPLFIKPKMINKGKQIICIETGEFFTNAIEAARKYNPNFDQNRKYLSDNACGIVSCLAGRSKTSYGLNWKYV